MRSLLDVNVLIALLDGNHIFHETAHEWFSGSRTDGWASCPITENAVVRIMTDASYKRVKPVAAGDVIEALRGLAKIDHQFWADDISIVDNSLFEPDLIHGSKQVTDVYLLALAVRNSGRFVTFDKKISLSTVPSAKNDNLLVIEDI